MSITPAFRSARVSLAVVAAAMVMSLFWAGPPTAAQQPAGRVDPAMYAGLRWRLLGPFRGGRVNGVTGVPGQPATFYFGSVGGGVWKTENAGRTWVPVFDSQPIASIGAITVAPSRPQVVYVGSGEADMRSQISHGNGVYRSDDGGATWRHLGLDDTRQIGRIAVDPANPDVVFVAALGHAYGPNAERGVFRSRDGGKTWQKVLFENENLGAIDVVLDPRRPTVVYASMWNTRRPPWSIYPPSYGPGSGVYKSVDGGSTWKRLSGGLPTEGVGRIGLAIAPANPSRVYAIVDAKDGGLYRSDDGGATWTRTSGDKRLWGRGWYFNKVAVDPKHADTVYVSNTSLYRSTDGGTKWTAIKGAPGGDDYHQLWIDPADPARMIVASDQGAIVTLDGAKTWSSWYNQPIAQIYHVAPDARFPYWVTGAQQDSGAVGVRSRTMFSEISTRDWAPLCAGDEAGYTAPDPLHPEILFGDTVTRCNVETGETVNVSPERGMTEPARHTWTLPLVFSKADPRVLYYSNQFLFRTVNGGESWTRISPDLTREAPGVPPNLDEATAKNAPEGARRGVIYTIAPSPVRAGLVWVGTDDGLVHVTRDEGKTWQDVTPPELTPWSKVVMMDASAFDVGTAYAAVDRHRLEDYGPHAYRTRDGGKTWQAITDGLPKDVYLQTIKADPVKRGLLFAGTELSVFVSFDEGDHWQSLQLNLPPVSVRDIAVHQDDLIVATHGRGFWVIDAMTALRQLPDALATAPDALFAPADALLLPPPSENGTPQPRDEPLTSNRPYGALIDYYVGSDAKAPVTLEVRDASGELVRGWSSSDTPAAVDPDTLNIPAFWRPAAPVLSASPGMHRWVWDLRPPPPPPAAGARGGGDGGRREAPLVLPGRYALVLKVGERTYTEPLDVKRDPRAR